MLVDARIATIDGANTHAKAMSNQILVHKALIWSFTLPAVKINMMIRINQITLAINVTQASTSFAPWIQVGDLIRSIIPKINDAMGAKMIIRLAHLNHLANE